MPVITISGSSGSNALDIGRRVAAKLKMDYVDREILTEAARALGTSEDRIQGREEHSPHFGERLSALLSNFLERSAAAQATDPFVGPMGLEMLMSSTYSEAAALPGRGTEVSDVSYKEAITQIVNGLAEKGNVVIIGRGSQVILKDKPFCLHVGLTAPFKVRAERIALRDEVPPDEARRRLQDADRGRLDYHRKYFKADPLDVNLYDVTMNTQSFGTEQAAQLIVAAYRRKFNLS